MTSRFHSPAPAIRIGFGRALLKIHSFALALVLLGASVGVSPAQPAATGSLQGRVADADGKVYLANTRITVEGTNLETFTDTLGYYQIANVPAGAARVKAFVTGRLPQTVPVSIAAGQASQLDFNLARVGLSGENKTVKLEAFEVSATREMDGAAIAINEQRFAPDIRNVIAADEFGPKGEGEIGAMLQFVPGIDIRTATGNAYSASINGVPADNVPVTIDGFDLASARENTSRQVVLVNLPTTHSVSRVEVLQSPTPESPGMALAGSINVVPLSAFDRAKPVLNLSMYLTARSREPLTFGRTPGPRRESSRKILPGLSFSYIVPVNNRFGFTLSGGASEQYLRTENMTSTWRGTGAATTGAAFPDTTPENPYLSAYDITKFHQLRDRQSYGVTIDYKLSPNDRLSFSVQYVENNQTTLRPLWRASITQVLPGEFGTKFTHGAPGGGALNLTLNDSTSVDEGLTPTLTYRHNGPVWRAVAGLGQSSSEGMSRNISRGQFFNVTAVRNNVTVAFDDNAYHRPGRITVKDGVTGATIDPFALDSFVLTSSTFHTRDEFGGNAINATQQTAYANLGRDFIWRVPFALKVGLDARRNVRDMRTGGQTSVTHVGRDGQTSNTTAGSDDGAGLARDPENTLTAFGIGPVELPNSYTLFEYYKANPSYFTTNPATTYTSNFNQSKWAKEVISSGYIRGDLHLLERRLKIVGGVRAEQTNVNAEGPLTDLTRNYQRDAAGNVIRGANGVPLPVTTDPLERAKLTLIERGQKAEKEYLRFFPSVNVGYNIRENLIARAAYYQSIGRPFFNQYAGGLTLPDTEAANQAGQRITVNNAGIKSWQAESVKVILEYYIEPVGLLSVGAFRREIKNFFGTTDFDPTPEFLALYGLDPTTYGHYQVRTQYNLASTVRMEGMDVNYKQALTFLPHWARGLQVFANGSTLRARGEATANFSGFVPRQYSWGFSISREKFNLKSNWNYRGRNRQTLVPEARGIAADTYRWGSSQRYLNVSGEYYFYKRYALWATYNSPVQIDTELFGPNTPPEARLANRQEYGALWTVGVKATY